LIFAFCLLPFAFAACRQDMHDQPKFRPLRPTDFFKDERSARPLVEGTVARGHLNEDDLLYTGRTAQATTGTNQQAAQSQRPQAQPQAAQPQSTQPQTAQQQTGQQQTGQSQPGQPQPGQGFANVFPFPVTKDVLDRGQERYNIFCSMCHDRTGTGNGMVVRRGYRQPPSLHIDRLRSAPAGHFFDVITNGFGAMPDYRSQIPARDRWAIIAYIRALQLSRQGTINDVPAEERDKLNKSEAPKTEGHQR
jgi:hypothetical protein